jgi:beta-galactosidase/beta-glucuronidase
MDGAKLGEHQGGYVPFAVELTGGAHPGTAQRVAIRVDDRPHPFKLEGKQGYGQARGMWQTVYLEARGSAPLASIHFTPDLRRNVVAVDARLLDPAPRDVALRVAVTNVAGSPGAVQRIRRGASTAKLEIALPNARRWSLEDPFLHEVTATVTGEGLIPDSVRTYFGMRSITVADLPGTRHPYVAINGKPVYLELALDQAYHPTGFYTFPSDSFTRMEILRARQIGLNGLREHIKIETPRKLYWADKLGVLIMAEGWWKLLHGLLVVVFIAVGIVAFIHPGNTFAALAAVFSFFLIFAGTFDIIIAISTRHEIEVWWLQLVGGIIEVALGFWAAGYYGRSAVLLIA